MIDGQFSQRLENDAVLLTGMWEKMIFYGEQELQRKCCQKIREIRGKGNEERRIAKFNTHLAQWKQGKQNQTAG